MKMFAWQRFKLLENELGTLPSILYLLDRLLRRINPAWGVYFYLFVAQPLRAEPRLPAARGKLFVFKLLKSQTPVLTQLGRPAHVIDARFLQAAQCLVATKHEALVGCIWFVPGAYAEDEVKVDYLLPPAGDCVWDFDVFVAESERLGFLFAKQWDAFDALLRPQGVRYTVSRINAFNQRSVASHQSLGAQACGQAMFLRLPPFQVMLSDQKPYFALGGRPQLHISPEP